MVQKEHRRLPKVSGVLKLGLKAIWELPRQRSRGASQAKAMAGAKDRGMKQHHCVSQQGGYLQFWVGPFPA